MNLPGYKLEERIGRGGMATVYRATQESLQRAVAVKVLSPHHADTPEFTERFMNEGRMLASLSHRHIIVIHDIGVYESLHYIAMEYLEGGDLKQRIRQGMDVPTALEHAETIATALDYAHCKGIVHRDVKPANVMFREDGTLLLTDFGIAKQLDGDSDLTVTGSTIGSPHYLSPEQAQGRPVDPRADVYSIGIMLFEMLTGKRPYRGDSDIETVLKHLNEPVPRLPLELAGLQPLLERLTAKDRAGRFDSAEQAAAALGAAAAAWREGRAPPEILAPTPVAETERAGVPEPASTAVVAGIAGAQAARGWLAPVLSGVALGLVLIVGAGFAGRAYLDRLLGPGTGGRAPEAPSGAGPIPEPPPAPSRPRAEVAIAVPAPEAGDARVGGEAAAPRIASSGPVPPREAPAAVAAAEPVPPIAPGGAEVAPEAPAATATAVEPVPQADPGRTDAAPEAPGAPSMETVESAPRGASRDAEVAPEIPLLLASADRAIEEFRLTRPTGNSALDYIEQVLRIDPANEAARNAFERIAGRYAVLARSQQRQGNPDKARLYVARGLEVDEDNAELRALDDALGRPAAPRPTGTDGAVPAPREIEGETPAQLFNRIKRFFGKKEDANR